MMLTLEEIAKLIDAKVYGESSKEILGMNTLDNATVKPMETHLTL